MKKEKEESPLLSLDEARLHALADKFGATHIYIQESGEPIKTALDAKGRVVILKCLI